MEHKLPELNYALDALEPHISKTTMEYHYGKHHQKYVDNLNQLIPGTKFQDADLTEIIKQGDGGIFNNGSQVWNHTFYFESFTPEPEPRPGKKLMDAMNDKFGSFDAFKEHFSKAAATLFGSGWVWLVRRHDGSLEVISESNAGNPLRIGITPILTIDVWEHAYYLDVQNRKPDYIAHYWNIVDWETVSRRYSS